MKLKIEHHSGETEVVEVESYNPVETAEKIQAQNGPVVIGNNIYHWSTIKKIVVVTE